MNHLYAILIAVDQLLNTIFGGGWPDETLSAWAWRKEQLGKGGKLRRFIDALLFFDKDHCFVSYESERLGRQLPPEYRPVFDLLGERKRHKTKAK